ncbi:pumilio homolog 3-like [Oncorhynchus masou masou]|uniref:pumilio homolog 3-like n=1 Tax=Oncorhynchus masou masou TaxID=90313 RepID=UPI0031833850
MEAGRKEHFFRVLLDMVGIDKLKTWAAVNHGAIVLCCADGSVAGEIREVLKAYYAAELQKIQHCKGVEVMLEKLA